MQKKSGGLEKSEVWNLRSLIVPLNIKKSRGPLDLFITKLAGPPENSQVGTGSEINP